MTDFCFPKALTIQQLTHFRTPALPYYADRPSLAALSGRTGPACLAGLQPASTAQRQNNVLSEPPLLPLLFPSGPGPQLPPPAHQELCRPCCHDNQVKIYLTSALDLCAGSDGERTAPSFPLRLSRGGPVWTWRL